MLGKRPCLLHTTSSRSLVIPCDDAEEEPATFYNYGQVTGKNPSPALSAPCKIVIGFDIGAEKKPPPDACESPRSVLDTLALLPSQEKQHVVARSPRSGLGSLLTAKSGSGFGLEIVAHIQAKEVGVHADSISGSFRATFPLQNCLHETCPDKMSLSVKSTSKDTGWLDKASNSDFMDADILSWQRQAPCVLHVEDERLDADISPLQHRVTFIPPSQDTNSNFTDMNISPYQCRALNACISMGLKDDCLDADIFPECSQVPWQIGDLHATPRNVINKGHINAQVSPSGVSYAPGIEGSVGGCKNAHIPTWQSGALSLCEDGRADAHMTPRQRQALHQVSLDMDECEEISIQRSIFSTASPPPCPHSLITSSSAFLKICAFCGHSLRLGKDIFMYRGDQAFCSAECRYQKIVLDERKEKRGS